MHHRGLRQDHHQFHKLESGLATSLEFFKSGRNTYGIIAPFCNEHPSFTKWIAEVKAPFNSIRAYYKEKFNALANSNAATAYARDGAWQGAMDKIMEDLFAP